MIGSISVVTSVHQPDDPRILNKSIRTLVDAAWDVEYQCPTPGPTESTGFSVRLLRGPRLVRSLVASVRLVLSPRDVTVAHDPELLPAVVVRGLMRGVRRSVFDVHENIPAQIRTRSGLPMFVGRLLASTAAGLLRVADRVATVTLAEEGYRSLVATERPVFPNLPVMADLPTVGEDAVGIAYVGDITVERGAKLLVAAATSLDEPVRLTLIGRCPGSLAGELVALAGDAVELALPGFLPYREAWERASTHQIGVSPLLDRPNYRLSLPTKIVEYRAVGMVCVVSDLPASLAAIRGSDAALSFPSGDLEGLKDALQKALENGRSHRARAEAVEVRSEDGWPAAEFASFYGMLVS